MKNPFSSLTVWGIVLAAVSSFLPRVGVEVDQAATADFIDHVVAAWPKLVETGGLLMALYGRWRATRPLSFAKKNRLP